MLVSCIGHQLRPMQTMPAFSLSAVVICSIMARITLPLYGLSGHFKKMKIKICCFIFLLSHVALAQADGMKLNQYNIKVNFDFSAKKMFINIELNIPKHDTNNTINLLLSHYASDLSVKSEHQKDIPYNLSKQDTLSIQFPKPKEKESNATLYLSYSLPADSFMVHREMYVMKRYDHWYPVQYGYLFNSTLEISVPENQITLSNGNCIKKNKSGKRSTFIWETNKESDLALFVFNPDSMDYKTEVMNGTRFNFYFVPGLKDHQKIISMVKGSFSFYSKLLGPYQNNNFTVIEIPAVWFLGQGLHTLLLFTPKLLETIPDPGVWIPHEVGHQWIGSIIPTDEQAYGAWFIGESLTEYLRAMYIENEYGSDSLKSLLKNVYLANYLDLVKDQKDYSVLDVKSVNSSVEEAQCIYAKGPLIFHQLRKCLGEKKWANLLKEIYLDFQNKYLTLNDLKKCLSKYDNNGNCLKSLDDYLISKGIPASLCLY